MCSHFLQLISSDLNDLLLWQQHRAYVRVKNAPRWWSLARHPILGASLRPSLLYRNMVPGLKQTSMHPSDLPLPSGSVASCLASIAPHLFDCSALRLNSGDSPGSHRGAFLLIRCLRPALIFLKNLVSDVKTSTLAVKRVPQRLIEGAKKG